MLLSALVLSPFLQAKVPVDLPPDSSTYITVDRAVRKIGRADLRSRRFAAGDVELRLWSGFSWGLVNGFILTRRSGAWRATLVRQDYRKPARLAWTVQPIAPPARGWNAVWSELDALGLRTIPDEASLPDDGVGIDDGTKLLFEVRRGAAYRAFYYDNPEQHTKRPTAQAAAKMARIVARTLPGGYL